MTRSTSYVIMIGQPGTQHDTIGHVSKCKIEQPITLTYVDSSHVVIWPVINACPRPTRSELFELSI